MSKLIGCRIVDLSYYFRILYMFKLLTKYQCLRAENTPIVQDQNGKHRFQVFTFKKKYTDS